MTAVSYVDNYGSIVDNFYAGKCIIIHVDNFRENVDNSESGVDNFFLDPKNPDCG